MEEANKKPRTVECSDEEHDRLSNLSDELILRILSFLSTKEAYTTCILSKRWESICTKIPDLDFELREVSDPNASKTIQSVYATLLRRTKNLRKLTLFSDNGCQSYDVHLWVSKALDLKVQELDVECWSLDKPTLLPLRLSMSKSLVVLKLHGEAKPRLNSSFDVSFPSLKVLHLQYIVLNSIMDDQSEYNLSNFLSRCPHLEEFLLHDIFKQSINIGSFHSLKRLYLLLEMPVSNINMSPLQINAPSLEVLSIVDFSWTPRKYELINLSNLDQATLQINHSDFNSLYTLLKGLSNVKSLTINSETIHFLSMEDNLDVLDLLIFHNLLFLYVKIFENYSWNMLVSFLQHAPKLEDLAIEKKFETKEVGKSNWTEPSVTPKCLSNSLLKFEFKGIQNIQAELDFAQYIINHSTKLKKVKIFTPDSKKSVEQSLLQGSKISSVQVWGINSI